MNDKKNITAPLSGAMTITELAGPEIPFAHALVMRVFDEFIGPGYSAEGCDFFRKFITPEYIAKLPERNGFSLVARSQDTIIGLFSIRDADFITLFFVDPAFHNKGVGKRLFLAAKTRIIEKHTTVKKLDVHSSPYAENIYIALGFTKTGDEKEENGIRFVPMEYTIR
jgi:GNAT superfamily N-acetyltransferase